MTIIEIPKQVKRAARMLRAEQNLKSIKDAYVILIEKGASNYMESVSKHEQGDEPKLGRPKKTMP